MILLWLILVLVIGGILAWIASYWNTNASRWISLIGTGLDFILAMVLWIRHFRQVHLLNQTLWLEELNWRWIPQFGIHFHLALDGLSLLLLMLTFFLGMLSVLCSWTEIQQKIGFFHFNLLWTLAGVVGVFLAMDLFLFYFAWELMLVPMYFLIALWGHERRVYAALKFIIFTQFGGLLMLVAIVALYFAHFQSTGTYSFQYEDLLHTSMDSRVAFWIMLGFFAAFAVKLPMVPFHPWLPDAHTEAPTAGSVILAGLLLKTGAYGLLRFLVPLFPAQAHRFAPVPIALGVIGILYGALLAFAQTDLKRLIAYTSVSHLGFVLIGIFTWNTLALQGAVVTMVAHGISTGALFVLVGALQERVHTREMGQMSGLWATVPVLSGATLLFALASLGLPGLGDFVGEFLVLLGTYRDHVGISVAATFGVLGATFYALKVIQGAFYGPNVHGFTLPDLNAREVLMVVTMALSLFWLGLNPQPVLDTFRPALNNLLTATVYVQGKASAGGRP
jgi:NADH-quinone oxidoreductase subunit M